MKLNFRKIASVLASTAMLSSTLALAAAANYPAPFVQNGNADVAVVYGSLPGHEFDLSAVTTITGNLQAKLSAQSSSSGSSTTTSTSGETYPLFTGSTKIYLNDSMNVVRSTLTDTELETVLSDGDFSGNVEADFIQTITLGSNPRVVFDKLPTSDDDPTVGVSLSTNTANNVYNATVTFDRAVNFTHTDSEGEDIVLFGQKFTVGSATDHDEIVLFKSSETATLTLGGSAPSPSTSVTVDGKTYTVELISASDSDATLKVTDSAGKVDTKKVNEATSKTINGIEVAVNIADESDATNTAFAEVTVGAQKIILQSGSEVKIGSDEDAVEGTSVDFTGSPDDITVITVQVAAGDSDEDAILKNASFVDPVFGTFKLNFAGITIPFDSSDRETFEIKASGNDKLSLKMATHKKDSKTITIVNNESGAGAILADSDRDRIRVVEGASVNKSHYTILGNEDDGYLVEVTSITNATTGYDDDKVSLRDVFSGDTYEATITSEGVGTITVGGKSYSLTYSGAASAEERSRTVQFNSPDSSANAFVVYPTIETSKGAKMFLYENLTLNLAALSGNGTEASGIASTLRFPDGDGYADVNIGYTERNITLNSVLLGNSTGSNLNLSIGQLNYQFRWVAPNTTAVYLVNAGNTSVISVPAVVFFEEEDDDDRYEALIVRATYGSTSDTPVSISDVETTYGDDNQFDNKQRESNDDLYDSMDFYGTLITEDRTDSDQYSAIISYPDEQVNALIYAGELNSEVTSTGSGSGTKELGSVHVKDTEVASVSSKNLIVVGGSCVNTLARELLGGAACGSDFEQKTGVGAGSFLIQSFSRTGGKVATLVAGYSAADTEAGAKVLTTQTVDTTVGKKYKGTGNTVAMVDTTSA